MSGFSESLDEFDLSFLGEEGFDDINQDPLPLVYDPALLQPIGDIPSNSSHQQTADVAVQRYPAAVSHNVASATIAMTAVNVTSLTSQALPHFVSQAPSLSLTPPLPSTTRTPAPSPPEQRVFASSRDNADTAQGPLHGGADALILQGDSIAEIFPHSINFVCGCSGFLPLQNEIFLEVVRLHFTERLQDRSFFDMCGNRYPVRDEVQPILDRARQQSSVNDVRIWTVVGRHRLKESNWMELQFEDVTTNAVRRRERLESPLRSVLTKLYTNSTSSKTSRIPNAPVQPVTSDSPLPQTQTFPVHRPPFPEQHNPPPDSLRRTHDEMATMSTNSSLLPVHPHQSLESGMWRQICQPSQHVSVPTGPIAPPVTSMRILPQTDRSWELKGELNGLILYEDAMTTELCEELNKPNTYVSSLSSVVNEQLEDQANTCLAKKVAKKWLDESSKSRWVCWIDASDPLTLTESYRQLVKKLRMGANESMEQDSSPRRRLSCAAAASEFFTEFQTRFHQQCECLIVYINVTHPEIFVEGFLPSLWLHDSHCQRTLRGVLLATPHPMYDGDMGPPFGSVVQHSIEWIPHWSESEQRYWWDRLPQSNLPPLLDDVEEPSNIDKKLVYDGRAVALVDLGCERPTLAGGVANQFARRWEMMESTERFSMWLRAGEERSLRDSYRLAIRRVTHSTPQTPLGNPVDLSIRVIGDELMSILMKMRELSPKKQWIMVFADVGHDTPFHESFFSAKSNWWNSRGRFLITSTNDQVEVEVLHDGQRYRKKVEAIICR